MGKGLALLRLARCGWDGKIGRVNPAPAARNTTRRVSYARAMRLSEQQ